MAFEPVPARANSLIDEPNYLLRDNRSRDGGELIVLRRFHHSSLSIVNCVIHVSAIANKEYLMFGRKNENEITEEVVRKALSTVNEPELHKDLISLNMIRDITINGGEVGFTVVLTTPACPLRGQMEEECIAAVQNSVPGVTRVHVRFDSQVRSDSRIAGTLNLPIKNIIAVASGKGGVGKSTVSVNLAVGLALEGARVGLLDADIYGPNLPMMMGVDKLPPIDQDKLVPATAHGVQMISMGFLMPEGEALVWRGPMLHKAIQQLFTDVRWGELDYMIVDLPPGTGDAQLSLAQTAPLTGGIIVTMPQMVSVADARRGAMAFKRMEVPILGVIENMSGPIFGEGGGERAAQEVGSEFLGRVPLDPDVRVSGDDGTPIVIAHPDSEAAKALRKLARLVAARVSVMALQPDPQLRIL
jgi:ATP-binding protein involved in chromosome partitioning